MFQHLLVTAFRYLIRNKFYTAITVTGLAFGTSSVFLITQYLKQELSYDRFHTNAENIYRVAWINTNSQTRTPYPMAQAMVDDFPEVESAVSLSPIWGPGLTRQVFTVRDPEKDVRYDESNVLAVDSTFFKVFSFPLVKGDPRTVLKNPGGILLSESAALKYFGTIDAVGKQLEVDEENNLIQVIGVFKDVPKASHFHFDILVPILRLKLEDPNNPYYTWEDFGHFNYVRLKPGVDARALEKRLLDWSRKYVQYRDDDIRWLKENKFGFALQPITSIHLQSHLRWELEPNGNISYVYLMAAAALMILIVGTVNFVNLSLAQATERTKEIGIRKSLGAFRLQLTFQFLGESVIVTTAALVISIFLIEVSLPLVNSLTGITFLLEWRDLMSTLLPLGFLVSMLSGIYPALLISSAKPALILKDKIIRIKGVNLRKAFIVFQFAASMALISSSIIISEQINFLHHKELGFEPEEVIVLPIKERTMGKRVEQLRTELLKINGVIAVSATSNIPGKSFNQNPIFASLSPEERRDASEEMIDVDYFKVMNMVMVEGRQFLKDNPADSDGFILNETAVRQLGIKEPIGKEIVWERDGPLLKGPIIGVVKDFHFQSLHEPLRPLLMRLEPSFNFAVIKLSTNDFETTLKSIEKTWLKFDDKFHFEFSFLDTQLNQLYTEEQSMVKVLDIFSFLGIGIASLGLLGIAALAYRKRTKEVSIRKVLGASLPNLVKLLISEFTQLVLIAIFLAVPLVWWAMGMWLQNFSFKITVNPMVFVLTGGALMLVAWITLGFLTIKTAQINPAETLKSE